MPGFSIHNIDDSTFALMKGKSFKLDCTTLRDDLRLVKILHIGFDDEVHEGKLVVNKSIAADVLSVFEKLYESRYQIERVELIDKYNADDEASMRANNSSAFNFRFISYTTTVSNHGLGLAVDINPLYNPYVKMVGDRLSIEPLTGEPYVDRSLDFPHKIDHDDLAYKFFLKAGFTWGGDWEGRKDYQHFEKV